MLDQSTDTQIILVNADALAHLRNLPSESIHCCVTSPPYWGLRDYGHDGQIGLEATPEAYVARMVEVFREVRRVLRDDGTCWLNLGDSYTAARGGTSMPAETLAGGVSGRGGAAAKRGRESGYTPHRDPAAHGLKHKDLVGIPWRVAFALQADGWWLRQDIIWHKPNPMPESVRDRCTKAHEYVFLLTKSERYFYDAEAVSEASSGNPVTVARRGRSDFSTVGHGGIKGTFFGQSGKGLNADHRGATRNRRSVWKIATKPYRGAHFAVMPPDLAETCIRAGCPKGGTVLDPFAGSGTTLAVAKALGRSAIGAELNPEYIGLAEQRIAEAGLARTKKITKTKSLPKQRSLFS